MVLNIVVQFQSNWNTYTQLIVLKLDKCLFLAPLGPLFLNLWDHNTQNLSQPSFSGIEPSGKIL